MKSAKIDVTLLERDTTGSIVFPYLLQHHRRQPIACGFASAGQILPPSRDIASMTIVGRLGLMFPLRLHAGQSSENK